MIRKRDKYYMNIAQSVASGSKCQRARFGSVIVSKDDRIVASGFNGKPRESCNDGVCYREGLPPNAPKNNCCLHSEENALLFSAPWERAGGTMYVTGQPCADCSLLIMQSGIRRLVYLVVEDGTHPGWTGENVFEQYGSKIEVVPYQEIDWLRLYGEKPESADRSP